MSPPPQHRLLRPGTNRHFLLRRGGGGREEYSQCGQFPFQQADHQVDAADSGTAHVGD